MLRSPLHDAHAALGATFTAFAGHHMPVHYGSIKDEHAAVRHAVGLFDVSHMSNLVVDAAAAIARTTPSRPDRVAPGRCKYTVLLNEDATILDDAIYANLGDGRFWMVPNAGRNRAVAAHLEAAGAVVDDVTQDWAILALQGPAAPATYQAAAGVAPPKPFQMAEATVAGVDVRVSGTGYTGEKGVEVYAPAADAAAVWAGLMDAGAPHGIRACGLGARDVLRLEKGYCLAGNEFAGGRTPLEANLAWLVDWDGDFLGKDVLVRQKDLPHARLWGLVQERGVPRPGYAVWHGDQEVGTVTSGTMSPSLGKGIALAYLTGVGPGDAVTVEVRGRQERAAVVKPPFV